MLFITSAVGLLYAFSGDLVEQRVGVGDFGAGVEIKIAGRFREHASCREIVAFPVGGIKIFDAHAGTGGGAVDEASVTDVDEGEAPPLL